MTEPVTRSKRLGVWWRWCYPLLLLAMAVAVPLLGWYGWSALSSSSEGTLVESLGDPTAPGFEAFAEPTPTLLLAYPDDAGVLQGAALVALAGNEVGGSVLLLPPRVATPSGTLAQGWQSAGLPGVVEAAAGLLNLQPAEAALVEETGWAALTTPGGLRDPDGTPAVDVSTLPQPNRRFFAALTSGGVRLEFLAGSEQGDVVIADAQALNQLLGEMVPFPTAVSPGQRPRVRLLNGVGPQAGVVRVASKLSGAGAEILLVGNAGVFGQATTTITYHAPEFQTAAEAYRQALGAGSLMLEERQGDIVDVTVVFGSDVADLWD